MAEIILTDDLKWMLEVDTSTMSPTVKRLWETKIRDAQSKSARTPINYSSWWLVENHGTHQWCQRKGISMQEHLKNCNNQYKRKVIKSERFIEYNNLTSPQKERHQTPSLVPLKIM